MARHRRATCSASWRSSGSTSTSAGWIFPEPIRELASSRRYQTAPDVRPESSERGEGKRPREDGNKTGDRAGYDYQTERAPGRACGDGAREGTRWQPSRLWRPRRRPQAIDPTVLICGA